MRKLEELWTEEELIRKFALPASKERNRIISGWIREGLKHTEISGIRLFREEDIVEFFDNFFGESKVDEVD